MKKNCLTCNKEFEVKAANQRFCCKECQKTRICKKCKQKFVAETHTQIRCRKCKGERTNICVECKMEYETKSVNSKFCCNECKEKHNEIELICIVCGKKYKVYKNSRKKSKFCSNSCNISYQNKHASIETRRKWRLAKIRHIEKNYGIACPNYNPKACEVFKKFDEKNNTKGRYAVYGNGEYRIPSLYYSLDYINFELKLIIEVDEQQHFEKSGELREYDVIRQREIQEKYPDFKFLRFKDNEMNKILEINIKELKMAKNKLGGRSL